MDRIKALVAQEGNDAAAEERIIYRLAVAWWAGPATVEYIDTDKWRKQIRKAQYAALEAAAQGR